MHWHKNHRAWLSRVESHVQDVETNPAFQAANEPLAKQKRHLAGPFPDGAKPRLFKLRAGNELAHLGTGVQLYFVLLKHLIVLLLVIGLIQLPQAIMSASGNMLRFDGIYKTVLGNIGNDPEIEMEDGHMMAEAYNNRGISIAGGRETSIKKMIIVFGCLDLLCTILTNCFMLYFVRWKTPKVVAKNDELVHAMSDHAIIVRRLPPQIGPEQVQYEKVLRQHFYGLISADGARGTPETLIPEVVVVRDDCAELPTLLELGKLKYEMRLLEARRLHGKKVSREKFVKKQLKVEALTEELSDGKFDPSPTRDACAAFVVFQHAADRDNIVREYAGSVSTWTETTQPHELRFRQHHLKVEPAPEPEDVILEHLHFTRKKRLINVLIIWFVVLLILIIVFFLCSLLHLAGEGSEGKAEKEARTWSFEIQTSTIPVDRDIAICDLQFYGDVGCHSSVSMPAPTAVLYAGGESTMEKTPANSAMCPGSPFRIKSRAQATVGIEVTFDEEIEMRCMTASVALLDPATGQDAEDASTLRAKVYACEKFSEHSEDFQVCTEARKGKIQAGEVRMSLLEWAAEATGDCDDVTLRGGSWSNLGHNALETLKELPNSDWYSRCLCIKATDVWSKCKKWYLEFALEKIAYWATLVLIQIVNGVMRKIIRTLVWKLEKPASKTDYIALVLSKAFIATFLNSGFLLLIMHTMLFSRTIPVGHHHLTGEYGEFNGEWYEAAGQKFMDYGMLHILFPRIFHPLLVAVKYIWRKCMWRRKVVQADLDHLYKRGNFSIDARLASIIAYTCFCLMYSGPIPLMPFTGVLALFITYWSDKMEVIYEDGNPPYFSEVISNVAVGLLEAGLIVKLIFSINVYGHPLVGSSCQVDGRQNSFLNRLIETAEEEGIPLRYVFNPEHAPVVSNWLGDRFRGVFFSCAGFPSVLYLFGSIAFIIVSLLFFTSLFWLPKRWTQRPGATIMARIHYKVDEFTEENSLADVIADLQRRGRATSYRPAANPAYKHVTHAHAHLSSRLGTQDLVSHFFEEPDLEKSPQRGSKLATVPESAGDLDKNAAREEGEVTRRSGASTLTSERSR